MIESIILFTSIMAILILLGYIIYRRKIDSLDLYYADLIKDMLDSQVVQIKHAREDAVKKSRAVLKGKISETMAPYLPGFEFNAGDARFMGSPIDFVIFNGMSDGQVTDVVIVDIKTGKSRLSKVQRQIRDVIREGKVTFETLKIE
jgi:predicted Holliday junction resolvase-like endonuclease